MLSRFKANVRIVDGEIITNYNTDWKKTCKYMFEDTEARKQHPRIKRVQPYIYRVRYYKSKARYHNRYFYKFYPNRSVVRKLGAAIEGGKVNAEQRIFY